MDCTFNNLIAPVFTPFNDDKTVNYGLIEKYAKYLEDKGIEGILVNGTSGEGMSLNLEERKLTAEEWMKHKNKSHIMIQVGGAPLPDVLELARHAEEIKADSILCLPELYMKPKTTEELIEYLKIVGEAAPKTPLLYYHIPMFTNVDLHMGDFMGKIRDQVPTFSGIKFTSNDLSEGMQAVKANDGKFEVFLGSDTLMLGAYALGFESSIATTLNIFPELGKAIKQSFNERNNADARKHQDKLSEIVYAITKYGPWVPSMKAAMNLTTNINCGPVRAPMQQIHPEELTKLKLDLNKLLINKKQSVLTGKISSV